MEDKKIAIENAQDLANSWYYLSYSVASNIMRKYPKNWDGFVDIQIGKSRTTVFSQWMRKSSSMLFSGHYGYDKDKQSNLDKFKRDFIWWLENKDLPKNKSNIDFKIAIPGWGSADNYTNNKEIYEEWCNIWLDSSWIEDEATLSAFLLKSVLSDNTNIVKKLVNSHGLDINQDITSKSQEYYFDMLFKNRYYNPRIQTMKLGFFVKSEKMAKTLSDLGFNWDVKVLDHSLLDVMIQKKDKRLHLDSLERSKILRFISDTCTKEKGGDTKQVIASIKDATTLNDIGLALRNANLCDIRDENGENAMHLLAKYAPRAFKKYAFSKDGLGLMDTPDNDGRYPLDYFFCFASYEVLKNDIQKIVNACEKYKLRKPNWLEVKMLIVENQATYSAVDSAPMHVWKQETPEEFKACLKTERGQKFIEMAANYDYKARKSPAIKKTPRYYNRDSTYCGMEIAKYTSYSNEKNNLSFFEDADTKAEIELSLLQLARILATTYYKNGPSPEDIKRIFNTLLKKTIKESSVDVTKLKEKMLKNSGSSSSFDKFMCENFDSWKNLTETIDRSRLLLVVEENNRNHTNRKGVAQSAL